MKKLIGLIVILTCMAFSMEIEGHTSTGAPKFIRTDNSGQLQMLLVDNQVDDSTGAVLTIEYEHHEIHEGDMYQVCTYNASLGDGVSWNFSFKTPNTTKWAHLVWEINGKFDTEIYLYRSPSDNIGGIAITANNVNENSTKRAQVLISGNVETSGSFGTLICSSKFGDDTEPSGKGGGGGESRADLEWVLKQNTTYLFNIISRTAANVINARFRFYEHTDVN